MPMEAGRYEETDMPESAKVAILQALLEETIEVREAAILLGFQSLACEMEIYCQHLETMIRHPDGEPIIRLATSFTQFEMN